MTEPEMQKPPADDVPTSGDVALRRVVGVVKDLAIVNALVSGHADHLVWTPLDGLDAAIRMLAENETNDTVRRRTILVAVVALQHASDRYMAHLLKETEQGMRSTLDLLSAEDYAEITRTVRTLAAADEGTAQPAPERAQQQPEPTTEAPDADARS